MTPKLRFPEFNCSWEKLELSQAFDYLNGKAHEQFIDNEGSYILVNSKFISTEGQTFKRTNQQIFPLQKDDICMVLSDVPNGKAIAKCFYISQNDTYTLNQRICALRNRNFVKPKYAFYVINRNNYFLQFDSGVGQTNLRKSDVLDFTFYAPDIEEQQKIASVLTTVDQKINLLTKKKEALETYKKGLMQKIFSQELRFKRKDGTDYPEWTTIKLKDVLEEYSLKTTMNDQYPILSSTNSGLYFQSDYFKHQVASKDNVGYKVIRAGMVVLSPQNLWMGNINVNQEFEIGIVSPSYKIFKHSFLDDTIAKEWLINPRMLFNYMQASEQGASIVRRNLSLSDFYDIKFSIPSSSEETKRISKTVSLLDKELHTLVKKLEATTQLKKGLLQQMFV